MQDLEDAIKGGDAVRATSLLDDDQTLISDCSADGFPMLALAAHFGHPAVVRCLLERGAVLEDASENPMQVRAIHAAAATRDPAVALQIAEMLVAEGADVNARRAGGFTALHEAARNANLPLIEFLLAHGADKTARADNGKTPREMALDSDRAEAARRLE